MSVRLILTIFRIASSSLIRVEQLLESKQYKLYIFEFYKRKTNYGSIYRPALKIFSEE